MEHIKVVTFELLLWIWRTNGEMYSIPKFSPPLHQSCLKLMCPSFLFPWEPSTFPLQMIYQLGAKLAGHRYVTDVGSCTSDDKAAEEGRSFYPQIPLIFQDTSLHKYTRYLIMIFWQLTSIDHTSISVLEKLEILGKIECLDEGFCGKKKVSLGPTFVFKQGFIWLWFPCGVVRIEFCQVIGLSWW